MCVCFFVSTENSKVLLVVLSEESLKSLISFTNISNIVLKASREPWHLLSRISHAVIKADFIRVSVVSQVGLKFSKHLLMLFLFAQRDLLNISEVVTDMLWLIALALHAFKISDLHSLHGWGNIVGELCDCVDRLFPEGL